MCNLTVAFEVSVKIGRTLEEGSSRYMECGAIFTKISDAHYCILTWKAAAYTMDLQFVIPQPYICGKLFFVFFNLPTELHPTFHPLHIPIPPFPCQSIILKQRLPRIIRILEIQMPIIRGIRLTHQPSAIQSVHNSLRQRSLLRIFQIALQLT